MINQRSSTPLFSERTTFMIVFGLVTLVLLGGSLGVAGWIRGRLNALSPQPQPAPAYTNYIPGSSHLKPESLAAMTAYITANPQPKNVQVLKGMSTAQIANYMVNMVAGGLRVDCTYCHNLANGDFSSEENLPMSTVQNVARKTLARQMMLMAADLNQNWISQLPPAAGGKQVTCATCHNGQAISQTYPADQSPIPDNFRLPLDNLDVLLITGKADPSLAAVQLNQYTMAHMRASLGVGCAFCHNARYFPSNEKPQKSWALVMLKMAQHIDQQYKPIMANLSPSCWMCHQGAYLPPGSANSVNDVPAVLSSNPPK